MTGPLLTPPVAIPPKLEPLARSHEADDIETDLKAIFVEVFESMLRAAERRINTYGIPHRGTFQTVERFTKAAGLAMERRTAREVYMAELFRAWLARNPRRGTKFLRHYLQLLWPNQWTLVQLWQDPGQTYPTGAGGESPGRFLTSRLSLSLEIDDQGELNNMLGSFRAALPAKFVLTASLRRSFTSDLRLAAVFIGGEQQFFAGTAAP